MNAAAKLQLRHDRLLAPAAAVGATAPEGVATAVSDAVNARVTAVARELASLAGLFDVKVLSERHVAYAWATASRLATASKAQQQEDGSMPPFSGGGANVVLPSEYFGVPSNAYYPHAEVAKHEANVQPTHELTRGAMPFKELSFKGGADAGFVDAKAVALWWKQSGLQSAVKLGTNAKHAMAEWANAYATALLDAGKASGARVTPAKVFALAKKI